MGSGRKAWGWGSAGPGSRDEEQAVPLTEEEGGRQPGLSHGQMAAQLHDLRKVEAAKKEFEEYVRQQVSPPACGGSWGLPAGPTSGRGRLGLLVSAPPSLLLVIVGHSHQAHLLCTPGPA
jgi:hypothetical protein